MTAEKKTSSKAQNKTVRLPDGYEHFPVEKLSAALNLYWTVNRVDLHGLARKQKLLKLINEMSNLDYQSNALVCFLEEILEAALSKIRIIQS
jgi:hypothetical protein